jgi:hypothetical protein
MRRRDASVCWESAGNGGERSRQEEAKGAAAFASEQRKEAEAAAASFGFSGECTHASLGFSDVPPLVPRLGFAGLTTARLPDHQRDEGERAQVKEERELDRH